MDRASGVDVSHWTKVQDFEKVIGAGISVFGAKATEGNSISDAAFQAHQDGARSYLFEMVVYYHLARPGDAGSQAKRFLDVVGPLQPNERLALDIERSSSVDGAFVEEFYSYLLAIHPDRRHLLYGSAGVWGMMGNPAWPRAALVDLWAPRYKSGTEEPKLPSPWSAWTLWQWTDGGATGEPYECPGIGPCDASWFNGDVAALRRYVAASGPPLF